MTMPDLAHAIEGRGDSGTRKIYLSPILRQRNPSRRFIPACAGNTMKVLAGVLTLH